MKSFFLLIAVVVGLVAVLPNAGAGPAFKEIDSTVVLSEGKVEIREYGDLQLVTGPMDTKESRKFEKSDETRGDSSFKTLFKYMGGANAGGKKFPMRAPIIVNAENPKALTMSFVLQEKKKGAAGGVAPAPESGNLKTETFEGGYFAALKFKGSRSREAEMEHIKTLRAWLKAKGVKAEGGSLLAYYDPPWTPKPLQRNEILMRVSGASVKRLGNSRDADAR